MADIKLYIENINHKTGVIDRKSFDQYPRFILTRHYLSQPHSMPTILRLNLLDSSFDDYMHYRYLYGKLPYHESTFINFKDIMKRKK